MLGNLYQSCHSLRVVASLERLLSFPVISTKSIYICINFYSYSRIGTDENKMKIKNVDRVLLTTIRKAKNHCQDVDHCILLSERLEMTIRM